VFREEAVVIILGCGSSKAERAIQTIMYMACTFLVHLSLYWTDMGADDISFWPFTVKHTVWLYNRLPNFESGLTPMDLLTKQKADHRDILCSHVWGCPLCMLEPKLQMDRRFQSGIVGLDLVSSWGIQMSILLSLLIFGI
jgi:hypothetical protein